MCTRPSPQLWEAGPGDEATYEAKTAPASSPAICAEFFAWISPSDARTLFTAVLPAAYSCNIAYEHSSAKSTQIIQHRWQESLQEQF